jgi:hypothetical protein
MTTTVGLEKSRSVEGQICSVENLLMDNGRGRRVAVI